MTEDKKPKMSLSDLAEEFSVKSAPEDPEARSSREKSQQEDDKKRKRTNRMKAFVMGNVGNTGGG